MTIIGTLIFGGKYLIMSRFTLTLAFVITMVVANSQLWQSYRIAGPVSRVEDPVFGDVDLDGDMDFISSINGTIVLFLNQGVGVFSEPIILRDEFSITSNAVLADVDNDGDEDVVFCIGILNELVYLDNDGTGNFGTDQTLVSNVVAWNLYASDINADGYADFAVQHGGGLAEINLLNSNGSGGYLPAQTVLSANMIGAYSGVFFGDYDNDGDLDIAAANNVFGISWASNLGSTFGAPTGVGDTISTGSIVNYVATGDIDGDGDLDFVSDAEFMGLFYENVGGGSWLVHDSLLTSWGQAMYAPVLEDLDLDGDLDIAYRTSSQAMFVRYLGALSWSAPEPLIDTINFQIGTPQYVDLNTDGINDLVAGIGTSYSWIPGAGVGAFDSDSIERIYNGQSLAEDLEVKDLDGNGTLDILVSSSSDQDDVVYWNDGSGNFSPAYSISQFVGGHRANAVGDMDGDGDFDIVSGNGWYKNDAPGLFSTVLDTLTPNGSISAFATGDVDSDGDLDIVYSANAVNGGNRWMESDGAGNIVQVHPILALQPDAGELWVGDLDGDLDNDILVEKGEVRMAINDGAGNFSYQGLFPSSSGWLWAKAGDVEGDGDVDIVVYSAFDIGLMINDGLGNFTLVDSLHDPDLGLWHLSLGDMHNDGWLDIVSVSIAGTPIAPIGIWPIRNDSISRNPIIVNDETAPADDIKVEDINGDGLNDVVVGSVGRFFRWYENPGVVFSVETSASLPMPKVVPNPFDDIAHLLLPVPALVNEFRIVDLSGRRHIQKVVNRRVDRIELRSLGLRPGFYLLLVTCNQHDYRVPIVVGGH